MKYFFDSNVIVDALTDRAGSVEEERRLLYAATVGEIEGIMSAKQMTDIYYVLRKHISDDKARRDLISILLQGFQIVSADKVILSLSLLSRVADYEDAVIAESAKQCGADCIITNDVRGFRNSGIDAKTPQEVASFLGIR